MKKIFKLAYPENIVVFGRTATVAEGTVLFWTGSAVEFNIKASELYINIECGYDERELMLGIMLDGERSQKLTLENGIRKYTIFKGMDPERSVNVRVVRDTQCMSDDEQSYILLKDIETDGGFGELPQYEFNIEFIGDSITSGEGCGLVGRVEWAPVVFDAIESYTYKTAKMLNARYDVLSQSGWGLYAAWDGDTSHVLPDYYEQICGVTNGTKNISLGAHDKYDFSRHEMDVVLINLATNDSNALKTDKFQREDFLEAFIKKGVGFLKKIRKNNAACYIVWAYGMLGDDMEPYIKEIIKEYIKETGDRRTEYLKLPDSKGLDLGARSHPTPAAHTKAAQCIADFIRSQQVYMLR